MKLFLTSAYRAHSCLDRVRELHEMDAIGTHQVVNDPDEADAIVFVENTQFQDITFNQLQKHPFIRRYAGKVFMYNEMDRSWPLLPGLYCSLSARMAGYSDHVAFPYLNVTNNGIQDIYGSDVEPQWLFSFVGSRSHAIRKQLFKLNDENARILDTSEFCTWNPTQTSKYSYQKLYIDTMAASQFVLCPRGIGPASLRLYETIEAGRVPVIISDDWVEPPQIDWSFAVRVPEWDIQSIPKRLSEIRDEWPDRAIAARQAWESSYAPNVIFNTFAESLQGIVQSGQAPQSSLSIVRHKYSVAIEQAARNWLKPPAGLPASTSPTQPGRAAPQSFLHRLFSR